MSKNDKIRVGVIGPGGAGRGNTLAFAKTAKRLLVALELQTLFICWGIRRICGQINRMFQMLLNHNDRRVRYVVFLILHKNCHHS